jgi:hypothetical protein
LYYYVPFSLRLKVTVTQEHMEMDLHVTPALLV